VLAAGERYAAGSHAVTWDGRDAEGRTLSSGVYFCRLQAAGQSARLRLLLLK
jgi:flagellar hook assembly protein FlgD